jgi:Fe-S-cluster containining protein
MLKNFKQFVPSNVCLKCDGCCRFKESDSRWRPYIGLSEMKEASHPSLPDRIFGPQAGHSQMFGPQAGHSQMFGKHVVGADHKINTTPCADGHLCHFLNPGDNTCGIYHARPFECQLYPFLLGREDNQAVLYVHLNCPHIQQHWNDESYQEYSRYLQEFFKRQEAKDFLKNNPSILTDYSEFRDELDTVCTIALE